MIEYPNKYEKITILCYPANAGGNFLINCLSLSGQCVFRDAQLANKQIQGNFNYADKIQYLHTQLILARQNNKWNDLNLGCANLFGVNNQLYLTEYPELLALQFDTIINKLIELNLNVFLVAHSTIYLEAFIKFWPNARIIMFTDYQNFINQRINYRAKIPMQLINYWNVIKGPDWPELPPTNEHEFISLPASIQQELKNEFSYEISRWFDRHLRWDELFIDNWRTIQKRLNKHQYLVWNVENNYKNSQEFIKKFDECRTWLNLPKTPTLDLINYFELWYQTIHQISSF